jgi:glycerol-3-phosphate cytidylyltransferase
MLKEARDHCDHLTVCIQVDPSRDRDWKNKPVQTVFERYIQVSACGHVDAVIIYETEQDLENILNIWDWDVRFIGEEYENSPITADWTREKCRYTHRRHDYSTSELRKRVMEANDRH